MGILESYDKSSRPIITPSHFLKPGKLGKKCIATFSHSVYEAVLKEYRTEKITESGTANGKIDVLRLIDYDVLFYMSPIGSAVAATILQEIQYLTNVKAFVFFGSCGVLEISVHGEVHDGDLLVAAGDDLVEVAPGLLNGIHQAVGHIAEEVVVLEDGGVHGVFTEHAVHVAQAADHVQVGVLFHDAAQAAVLAGDQAHHVGGVGVLDGR